VRCGGTFRWLITVLQLAVAVDTNASFAKTSCARACIAILAGIFYRPVDFKLNLQVGLSTAVKVRVARQSGRLVRAFRKNILAASSSYDLKIEEDDFADILVPARLSTTRCY